jgi:hypothetical protein
VSQHHLPLLASLWAICPLRFGWFCLCICVDVQRVCMQTPSASISSARRLSLEKKQQSPPQVPQQSAGLCVLSKECRTAKGFHSRPQADWLTRHLVATDLLHNRRAAWSFKSSSVARPGIPWVQLPSDPASKTAKITRTHVQARTHADTESRRQTQLLSFRGDYPGFGWEEGSRSFR